MKWSELTVEQRQTLIIERTKGLDRTFSYLTCYDLATMGLWSTGDCCESCHVDDEEYGYDLCTVHLPDEQKIYCCCGLSVWINDASLPFWHKTLPAWVQELDKSIE